MIAIAAEAERRLAAEGLPLQVAVMGCVVNGPGEARQADLGIAAGRGKGHLFVQGRVVRVVPEGQFMSALVEEGHRVIAEKWGEAPPPAQAGDVGEVIALTPVEARRPGRVVRRQ